MNEGAFEMKATAEPRREVPLSRASQQHLDSLAQRRQEQARRAAARMLRGPGADELEA